MATDCIRIVGARQHNLKNLTLSLPRDRLVVITGLSGSGKSSLAFDTLFAEGQRKYVESLSAYARQFLDQLQKPDVDYIEGLSPSIAIEQRSAASNPRSIIATTTEIYDYLRLLYALVGQPHCPITGQPITRQTPTEIVDRILGLPTRTRIMLLAPVKPGPKQGGRELLEGLAKEGFVRARIDGQLRELSQLDQIPMEPRGEHSIEVVVDRLVVEEKARVRVSDSVETALKWGEGRLLVLQQDPVAGISGTWQETLLTSRLYSPATGLTYEPPTPKHFSFNSPQGACPVCHGLGQKLVFDESLVVPDPAKSLEQGAVLPWRRGGKRMVVYYKALLRGLTQHYGQNLEAPYRSLPDVFKRVLMCGSGAEAIEFHFWRAGKMSKIQRPFEGVIPNLQRLYAETESEFTKNRLKGFMNPQPCDACAGRRLRPEILAVTLDFEAGDGSALLAESPGADLSRSRGRGLSIMGVCALTVERARSLFAGLRLSDFQHKVAGELIREIQSRLKFLEDVGLGYLTLDRESGTLSGGEAQRIRLATQIGAGLVGVLYILDEPSIGLHQRDNERLLTTLEHLRDLGNSVLVVEHDEDTIRRADYLVDLGPGAGVHGGELVACGTPAEVMANRRSLTGRYMAGDLVIPVPRRRQAPSRQKGWLTILGAQENNLRNLDVRMPLGTLVCVTGVSGSGKSTLVDDILRRALFRQFYGSKEQPGRHRGLEGVDQLDKVIVIDQTPIGRTPRSNPATYTAMFNHIRDLFSRLPAAKIRGYDAGRFSFNVKGGRCDQCQGDGLIKIEMQFLPPVYVTCEGCNGQRYNRATLEVTYKGLNIARVLDLTVEEAVEFFRAIPAIHSICQTLAEVGLGYLRLGQAATTLSGGEAQRVKLAAELSRRSTGRTLYIMDEPTTGLHFHDVAKLLEVLFRLRAAGNTLLVIEHNLDVIKNADWVIDLGPGGGDDGGRIVAEGTPEQVAACRGSHTGKYLERVLHKAAI
jgi:excinuclease ABC subunit A